MYHVYIYIYVYKSTYIYVCTIYTYLLFTVVYILSGWWFNHLEKYSSMGRIIPYIMIIMKIIQMFETTNQLLMD